MSRKFLSRTNTLEQVLTGIKKAAGFIAQTMGPHGKLVGLAGPNFKLTKDGANASKLIQNIGTPAENVGASLVVESSQKMVKNVGDGTTTAAAIFEALAVSSYNLIKAEYNINDIKSALNKIPEILQSEINKIKKPIACHSKELNTVAYVASNGDRSVGDKLSELINKLGKDFVILVEESKTEQDHITFKDGFSFDKGALSPYFFISSEEKKKMKITLDDAFVLVLGEKLSNIRYLADLINEIAPTGKPMLIVAEDFDESIQTIFLANKLKMNLNYVCVKAPFFGDKKTDFLEDLAIVTGTEVVKPSSMNSEELRNLNQSSLGKAKKIIVSRNDTTVLDGQGSPEAKNQRVDIVKNSLANALSTYDAEKLQERLARLTNGIGMFYVGGVTEMATKEKKERVEDAVQACKQAVLDGIVTGAGSEFLWAEHQISNNEDKILKLLVKNSFSKITRQIIDNSEKSSADVMINEIYQYIKRGNYNYGFNGNSGKVEDISTTVINPARVSVEAVKIACSFCIKFVDLGSILIEEKSEEDKTLPPMNPMMM